MRQRASYKLSIGYTIWDTACGKLPDLEDTPGWHTALLEATEAAWMIEVTDNHRRGGRNSVPVFSKHPRRRRTWYVKMVRQIPHYGKDYCACGYRDECGVWCGSGHQNGDCP